MWKVGEINLPHKMHRYKLYYILSNYPLFCFASII
nr:MAG TPA: hypothetical protein [Crassvirales sp.]